MKRNRVIESDDFKEIKQKIDILKVQDLQFLLNVLNLSKTGKKIDLQERILSLIKNGSLKSDQLKLVNEKIDEMLINKQNMSSTIPEVELKKFKLSENALPIQPGVKLKKIPFFDKLDTLLPTSTLIPSNSSSESLRFFKFCLTPQQAALIENNRFMKSSTIKYTVQVQLRFCLIEESEQNDLFPGNLHIRINQQVFQLPNFLPARPNTKAKRPSQPLNITSCVKISPHALNNIEIRWKKESNENFAVSCFLVRQFSSDDLFQCLKIKQEEFTRGMIKEKLSKEVDSEIATTMVRVSLNCPLGKTKMINPCRASTCSHLQCFDAMLYLQMNEMRGSWICPVCDREAIFDNLVIDGYFLSIIKSIQCDANEIQLNKDGSWSKLTTEKLECNDDSEIFISDGEDNNNNNVKVMKNDLLSNKKDKEVKVDLNLIKVIKPRKPTIPSVVCTIDLTLDD